MELKRHIFLIGYMGCGKSTNALRLSELTGAELLEMDEVKLTFEDDALEWIAEEAIRRDTGARALRAILEEFMLDIMYEVPKDPGIGTVAITRQYLEKSGGPRIGMRV